jgi:hypothetical protein
MSSRKPKKPKFPRKPKSSNIETLERWADRCKDLSSNYARKLADWTKIDDRKKSLIKEAEKAKNVDLKKTSKKGKKR